MRSTSIVVHGSQVTVDHVGWPYKPEGLTAAQLNLPFCVATLLLEGDCVRRRVHARLRRRCGAHRTLAQGEGGARSRPSPRSAPPARHKVRVEVHFRDGSVERETREAPRGSEQSFASADDIVGKFRKLTSGDHGAKQQDAPDRRGNGLDELAESAGQLVELLRA